MAGKPGHPRNSAHTFPPLDSISAPVRGESSDPFGFRRRGKEKEEATKTKSLWRSRWSETELPSKGRRGEDNCHDDDDPIKAERGDSVKGRRERDTQPCTAQRSYSLVT